MRGGDGAYLTSANPEGGEAPFGVELLQETILNEETGYRSESLSSRYPQLAIIDSLYTTLMFRNPNASESLSRIRTIISTTKEDH